MLHRDACSKIEMKRVIICIVQLLVGSLGYMKYVCCYRHNFFNKASLIASTRSFAETGLTSGDRLEINSRIIDDSGGIQVANLQQDLSNVKAVRYFINLTNGIEALAVLLKQGVPMENINVSSNAPPVPHFAKPSVLLKFSLQQTLKSQYHYIGVWY